MPDLNVDLGSPIQYKKQHCLTHNCHCRAFRETDIEFGMIDASFCGNFREVFKQWAEKHRTLRTKLIIFEAPMDSRWCIECHKQQRFFPPHPASCYCCQKVQILNEPKAEYFILFCLKKLTRGPFPAIII